MSNDGELGNVTVTSTAPVSATHLRDRPSTNSSSSSYERAGPNGEWASSSSHERMGQDGEWASSSSSASMHEQQNIEDDRAIAQALSEDFSQSGSDVGRRLTHLSSIPHVPRVNRSIPTIDDATLDHQRLLGRLNLYGWCELRMSGDGNCQFRALADQLYQTPDYHKFVRKQVVHQLKTHRDFYEGYVPMKFSDYLKKMSRSGEWGDHVTLQAAADHFGVRIYLLTSFRDTCFIEITPRQHSSKRDVFLSFWSEVHYNSIYTATVTPLNKEAKKKKHWLF